MTVAGLVTPGAAVKPARVAARRCGPWFAFVATNPLATVSGRRLRGEGREEGRGRGRVELGDESVARKQGGVGDGTRRWAPVFWQTPKRAPLSRAALDGHESLSSQSTASFPCAAQGGREGERRSTYEPPLEPGSGPGCQHDPEAEPERQIAGTSVPPRRGRDSSAKLPWKSWYTRLRRVCRYAEPARLRTCCSQAGVSPDVMREPSGAYDRGSPEK